ncbi:hypothetical protein D3C84_291650 [compost metagenome]
MDQGDTPGLACLGHFQRAQGQGLGGVAADDPFGDGHAFGLPVFSPAVKAFAVLAKDDEVDARPGGNAGPAAHRAQVGVELELLAQLQDGAAVAGDPLPGGGRNGAEQAGAAIPQGLEGGLRHGAAAALEAVPAGFGFHRMQIGQELLQHLHGHRHHFAANAVPGNHDKLVHGLTSGRGASPTTGRRRSAPHRTNGKPAVPRPTGGSRARR